MNREQYRKMLGVARKELRAARGCGYTDDEILESLRMGDRAQQAYADFIEHAVMKAG